MNFFSFLTKIAEVLAQKVILITILSKTKYIYTGYMVLGNFYHWIWKWIIIDFFARKFAYLVKAKKRSWIFYSCFMLFGGFIKRYKKNQSWAVHVDRHFFSWHVSDFCRHWIPVEVKLSSCWGQAIYWNLTQVRY